MNASSELGPLGDRDIPVICGIAVMVLGAVGIAGWLLHAPALVELGAGMAPMQFNTAAGFVMAGIGLAFSTRTRILKLFGAAFLLVIGIATLIEYATGLNLFIDQILFRSWLIGDPFPGRMALNTAGCFTVLGLSYGLSCLFPSKAPVMRLIGGMALVSMAGAALIGYVTGMESVYRWGQTTRMAAHSAAGFLTLGVGLGISAGRAFRLNRGLWLAGVAGVSAACVTMVIWAGALADHQRLLVDASRTVAANVAQLTAYAFTDTTAALTRFSERWAPGCREESRICERDLAKYFHDLPELTSLEWVDRATGRVIDRRAAPGRSGRDPLEDWRPTMKDLPFTELSHTAGSGPRIIVSVGQSEAPYFISFGLDPAVVISKATAAIAAGWNTRVTVDAQVVLAGKRSPQSGSSASWPIKWLGGSWEFVLSPGTGQANPSHLPDWILLGGMTVACFTAIIAYLWQSVRKRMGEIQNLNAALETKVAERTSDLVAANEVLRQQESQLERMFAGGRIGAWSRDFVSGDVTWRGPMLELFGLLPEQIPPTFEDFMKMVHPGDARAIHLALEDAVTGQREYNTEFRIVCPNGAVRWLGSQGSVTRDETGAPVRIEGIYLDISARKEAEIAREQSERQIRQLADAMPQIVWAAKPDGNLDYYNQRWYDYSGRTFEQTKDSGWQPMSHPDDTDTTLRQWKKSLSTGDPLEVDCRFERASDNSYRWHLIRGVPVRNADGEIVRWFGTATDIEDYKRAEAAIKNVNETLEERVQNRTVELATANRELELAKGKLQSLLNAATQVSIIATDIDGVIDVFNPGAERMLQYRAEEMVGIHTPAILHDPLECRIRGGELSPTSSRPPDGFDVLVEPVRNGRLEHREWTYVRKDGSTFDATLVVTAIHSPSGAIEGFLGIASDITAHKSLERELRLNNEKLAEQTRRAEEASRAKSDFLATMSHEIRTPMNAILGMADLLWESDLDSEQRPYVEVFRRAGSNLLTLINDILDLSKIEAGHFELERVNFNLEEVVDQAVELTSPKARVKGIGLMSRLVPGMAANVVGDPARLRQVLINLLGNAIKFTETGEIVLTLLAEGQGDPQRIEFSVSDTGIGIPADKLATIFDNFTQADSSTTRRYGGTGLGLSISRRIVELMGGTLAVSSNEGRGSTFFFTLAFDRAPEKSLAPLTEIEDLEGQRVLILEDNATNGLILCEALRSWGLAPLKFSSPAACLLEVSRAIREQQPYSLVIVDKCMPEIDGFAAAARIREIAPALPVIMLSSDSQPGDVARRREVQLTGYASKPVRRAELFRLVSSALRPHVESSPRPLPESVTVEEAPPARNAPLRILVAEDAADNRLLLQAYLKSSPHILTFAENGQGALEECALASFDIILMDIQMPGMDGLTATRLIRERERELHRAPTQIVALTANARPEDIAKSVAAGCDGHLTKPISKQRLLAAIEEHRRPTGKGNQPPLETSAPILVQMPEGLEELVPGYLAARKNEVPEMLRLLAASDFERLRVLGHNMKGNGAPYGFPNLTEIGAALEQSAKQRDVRVLQEELSELASYLNRVHLTEPSR